MAEKKAFLLSFSIIFTTLISFGAAASGNGSVPAIFVFGDSLADAGNNNDLPDIQDNVTFPDKANFPHNGVDFPGGVATGRFSNGYNGIDYLAMMLGFEQGPPSFLSLENVSQMLQGVNFASGGSGILDTTGTSITLTAQIKNFQHVTEEILKQKGKEATLALISKSLVVISTGNNDLFAHYSRFGPQNTTQNEQFITSLIDKFEHDLKTLHKLGIRKYSILGISHIGCVPFLTHRNPSFECNHDLNNLARMFNSAAKHHLRCLKFELNMEYSYSNIYVMESMFKENPWLYGLKEMKVPCCGSGDSNPAYACIPTATYCPNREDYYFWDGYHPTQAIYKLVGMGLYKGTHKFVTPMNIKQLVEI